MGTFPAYFDAGVGLPVVTRIPYFPGQARTLLGNYDTLILAGTNEPVTFFGYRDRKSFLLNDQQRHFRIDTDTQDVTVVLGELAGALDAVTGKNKINSIRAKYTLPELPSGKLNAEKMCATIAALQPEHCIVVDEGLTST